MLFPTADVSQMISRRPTLLLDEEFDQVGGGKWLGGLRSAGDTPSFLLCHHLVCKAAGQV